MLYATIMAGGSGTRFWPASRQTRPKQLLSINGSKTMIRATVERALPIIPFERIMVVTGSSHAQEIRNQLPEILPEMIVAEPVGRNTAPCIALAACKLAKIDPDAVMVVLPADHLIKKEEEFRQAVRVAAGAAAGGDTLITFGIVPSRPETGYGYIKMGAAASDVPEERMYRVESFVEKPDPDTATQYVKSGRYLWNSGMFVWRVSSILRAIERHLPALSRVMEGILDALNTPGEPAAISAAYRLLESVSIDYGVMEHADNVLTMPIDVDWNDVGSWASLDEVWGRDEDGNATRGTSVSVDSTGCIVSSPERLTALIGVDDLIVVDTPDALLVCRKDRAQDVKKLQEILDQKGFQDLL